MTDPRFRSSSTRSATSESIYRFATAAFVGGSLRNDRGGQNILEPLALGVPVLHGPDVPNFHEEARLLAGAKAAVVVHDEGARWSAP